MASRKKSVIAPPGSTIASASAPSPVPQIDTGVGPNNNLLKKAGTSSVSLYQQCTALTAKLSNIHDFAPYFALSRAAADAAASASSTTAPTASTPTTPGAGPDPSNGHFQPTKDSTLVRRSADPVQRLWDCLALGAPLCFLFNLLDLPAADRLKVNCDPAELDPTDTKNCKKLVMIFASGIRKLPDWEVDMFTIQDLISDHRNTNGFVKVVTVVAALVARLPSHVFIEAPSDQAASDGPVMVGFKKFHADGTPYTALELGIDHLVEAERDFGRDIEILQTYANQLRERRLLSPDLIHNIFLNMNDVLEFQRRVAIGMELILEQPREQQRWGELFLRLEAEFVVYEPFCANFPAAQELALATNKEFQEAAARYPDLKFNSGMDVMTFLIKPVQRITKYPLHMGDLVKLYKPDIYQYYDELLEAQESVKRVAGRVNEAERKASNLAICKALQTRVRDWKGHHIGGFGQLRENDLFTVDKSGVDRDYHVFLFERIILCCKEDLSGDDPRNGKKSGKSNSILKKNSTASGMPQTPAFSDASAVKRTTPLLLKGRIFLSNVTKAVAVIDKDTKRPGLEVWWRGDEDLEFFTLRCRTEEQMKNWEREVNSLVYLEAEKQKADKIARDKDKASGRGRPGLVSAPPSAHGSFGPNSLPYPTSQSAQAHQSMPAPHRRNPSLSSARGQKDLTKYFGAQKIPQHSPLVATREKNHYFDYDGLEDEEEEEVEEEEEDEDQYPVAHARTQSQSHPPPPRQHAGSNPSPLAVPNGAQMSNQSSRGTYPASAINDRARSAMGAERPPRASTSSPVPVNAQIYGHQQQRPGLRSKFSSARLDEAYDHENPAARERATSAMSIQRGTPSPNPGTQPLRVRSQSTSGPAGMPPPGAYSRGTTPPVPQPLRLRSQASIATTMSSSNATSWSATPSQTSLVDNNGSIAYTNPTTVRSRTTTMTTEEKRGSGSSSQYSGGSSGYSTNDNDQDSISPVTPYGSSDTNIAGSILHKNKGMAILDDEVPTTPTPGLMQHQPSYHGEGFVAGNPPMKVKVHYRGDLFVIAVARDIPFVDLHDKINKKIKLCGGDRDPNAPFRIKYRDDDGDLITLGSDDDILMAFDIDSPMITLWVT